MPSVLNIFHRIFAWHHQILRSLKSARIHATRDFWVAIHYVYFKWTYLSGFMRLKREPIGKSDTKRIEEWMIFTYVTASKALTHYMEEGRHERCMFSKHGSSSRRSEKNITSPFVLLSREIWIHIWQMKMMKKSESRTRVFNTCPKWNVWYHCYQSVDEANSLEGNYMWLSRQNLWCWKWSGGSFIFENRIRKLFEVNFCYSAAVQD